MRENDFLEIQALHPFNEAAVVLHIKEAEGRIISGLNFLPL
jgi:hypothetical protein